MKSLEDSEILKLVKDLEAGNATDIRISAAKRLGKITKFNRGVVDVLKQWSTASYHELSCACKESLDSIYLSSRLRKSFPKQKELITNVKISVENSEGLEIPNGLAYCKCNFCDKETIIDATTEKYSKKLSGPGKFYCNFCLRHKLSHRDNRHILLLSFRGVIGYYYHAYYNLAAVPQMYISEIIDYVKLHIHAGKQNPLFLYDPDSFLWFVDFARVGKTGKRISVEKILNTIVEILFSFNLCDNVRDVKPHKLYMKYEEAILKFYSQRSRPENFRILSPTMFKTGANEFAYEKVVKDTVMGYVSSVVTNTVNDKKRIPFEETRHFMPYMLKENLGRKF